MGKFLGAVGTGAAQGEHARELQRLIMTHLGLGVPLATTQVVGRDRYVEYMSWLANVATTCEKVLQEIRNLQRSELAEAGEGFDVKKQVGSSTMAHKKNPIKSENASGLARIVRSFIIPTYETRCSGTSETSPTPAANASRFPRLGACRRRDGQNR